MPPVMITMPTPMLKMPYVPTSRPTFWRFATLRNCGLAAAMTAHSTTSSRKTPSLFSCHRPMRRSRDGHRDGELHDGFGRAVGARQDPGDPAVVHHGDAVAFRHDLLHVAADHHHRGSRRPRVGVSVGGSRPWRRRRRLASARRRGSRAGEAPATCRARPSAGCRR